MSDDETPNPWKTARDGIEEILRTFLESAKDPDEDDAPMFLTDWIVVVAGHVPGPDGTSAAAYNRLVRDEQPPHNTLGLLTYELEQARAHLTRAHD